MAFRMTPFRILLVLAALVVLMSGWRTTDGTYHSHLERGFYRGGGGITLPVVIGTYFTTAGRCAGCHGFDSTGFSMTDSTGRDVNVTDDWRSTLMGNSARDPFFRAKLEHEVLMNPGHQGAIEGKCLSCHAPMGFHEERMAGHPTFTAAMLDTSALGIDGVGCLACHMQNPTSAGSFFSGDVVYDSARVYGPYQDDDIVAQIMEFFVGFTPGFGQHSIDGRMCAGCHSLLTETLDLNGNLTGDEFVEQATWHEWKNSTYSGTGESCRSCHMPRLQDSIVLAAEYLFLTGHTPYGLHHLVGGNAYMVQMLKDNAVALDVKASDVQFDSTIARTLQLLQHRTLALELSLDDRTSDTAYFRVELQNLAGHKFPSGYPSRRAIVEFVLLNGQGDTLFTSGRLDGGYEVEGHDAEYEPHYRNITSSDQAQIYELVMGDVNDDVTTILERAKSPLKDNRLVPLGFSTQHYTYDTTLIAGAALSDPDFNHDAFGVEGNGADIIHYHIPMNGYSGAVRASVRVLYQPVPPRWNRAMFDSTGAFIDAFRNMVDQADGTPTVVVADSLFQGPLGVAGMHVRNVRIFPNPTVDGVVDVQLADGSDPERVMVYDASGKEVPVMVRMVNGGLRFTLPPQPGTYLIVIDHSGQRSIERVVRP